jgi:hypothetical protein
MLVDVGGLEVSLAGERGQHQDRRKACNQKTVLHHF